MRSRPSLNPASDRNSRPRRFSFLYRDQFPHSRWRRLYWNMMHLACGSGAAIVPIREFVQREISRKIAASVPARGWPCASAFPLKLRSLLHNSLVQPMRNAENTALRRRKFLDAQRSPMQLPAIRWPSLPPGGAQRFRCKQESRKRWRDDKLDAVVGTESPQVRLPCRRPQVASPDWPPPADDIRLD